MAIDKIAGPDVMPKGIQATLKDRANDATNPNNQDKPVLEKIAQDQKDTWKGKKGTMIDFSA